MLRNVLILTICILLSACRVDDIIPIEVERSTIYHGQTIASLYDNFGVPNKQHIDPYGIRELHYNAQSILRKGVDNYMYFCDFVVYTDEGIVIDWQFRGNRCRVEESQNDMLIRRICRDNNCWIQQTEKEFYLE